jgi:hypothetical protein
MEAQILQRIQAKGDDIRTLKEAVPSLPLLLFVSSLSHHPNLQTLILWGGVRGALLPQTHNNLLFLLYDLLPLSFILCLSFLLPRKNRKMKSWQQSAN